MSQEPLVSIGVPTYNDAPWLRNALDHLLSQEHRNLEIILADDGSSDGSREICREYTQKDSRIRFFENNHNLGAVENHKFVFNLSQGDYFAWGSGHDYYHPKFVSKTLEVLQTNDTAVMCCSKTVFIDEMAQVMRTTRGDLDMSTLLPVDRFKKVLSFTVQGGTANIVNGLYRHDALSRVNLSRRVAGSDVILLGELSLLGEIVQLDEILFYRLINKAESGKERIHRHAKIAKREGGDGMEISTPYFDASSEFLHMAENCNLSVSEKHIICEAIIEQDVNLGKANLEEEITLFLSHATNKLSRLQSYPHIKDYRAAIIQSIINRAWSLDLEARDVPIWRSSASLALNLGSGLTGIRHEHIRPEQSDLDPTTLNYPERSKPADPI